VSSRIELLVLWTLVLVDLAIWAAIGLAVSRWI
jgi:hypothetical protein